jgi:hypothetical protein
MSNDLQPFLGKKDLSLLDRAEDMVAICSRIVDVKNGNSLMRTITPEGLSKIASMLPEANRAVCAFGRKNTQFQLTNMTLHMMSRTPLRTLRQILSQVEQKRMALQENWFKLLKERAEHDRAVNKEIEDPHDQEINRIEIMEKAASVANSMVYVEGALKEIAFLMSVYEQIRTNNNIPERWDERDMEEAEAEHHLKQAFLQSFRDMLSNGVINPGNMEYLEQCGVHPFTAKKLIVDYLQYCNDHPPDEAPDWEDLEGFLEKMFQQFKGCFRKVLDQKGINLINEHWYTFTDHERGGDDR